MTDTIASVRPYIVPAESVPVDWWIGKFYVLVRVETADGVVGWGESHVANWRERPLVEMIKTIGGWLTGRAVADIDAIADDAFNTFGQHRTGFEVHSAFAGIEIALWDILGKRKGVPVHQLLGPARHDAIPVYANTFCPSPHPPEVYAEMATRLVAAGHRAVKLYPFLSGRTLEEGLAVLAAVRDAVGPEIGLAVDLWRKASPAEAATLAQALAPFDLLWLEDPFPPTDAGALKRLRAVMPQPLLTGETLILRHEFRPLFDQDVVDMVNPDICLSGILEIQAIAAIAAPSGIRLSPHNSNTMTVGTAAALHAAVGITNLAPVEHFPVFETALDDLIDGRPNITDGTMRLPTGPGLGITVDETAIARHRV